MKIKVVLGRGEAVDDWTRFREVFERAAAELDLEVEQIIHAKGEL